MWLVIVRHKPLPPPSLRGEEEEEEEERMVGRWWERKWMWGGWGRGGVGILLCGLCREGWGESCYWVGVGMVALL